MAFCPGRGLDDSRREHFGPRLDRFPYNPVTNLIYACEDGGGLTVINASTLEPVASLGIGGTAVAVNPVTNTVYQGPARTAW